MFKDFETAASYIKLNDIKSIDLKFTGLLGKWHHVTLSSSEFNPKLMQEGVGFDGSSVGLKSVKSGDMVLIPDLTTGFLDPFWEKPTLSFICTIVEADSKQKFAFDPRFILQKAEEYLISSKIADESVWGPEFEFYVFSNVKFENSSNTASYSLNAIEAAWNSKEEGLGYYLPIHGGYHAIPPSDKLYQLRSAISTTLEEVGVPVKYHHHEVGGPGQCEIETPMLGALKSADAAMMIKYITRMVAQKYNQTVTFLPKPLFGEAGSGMHFHQQLFKNKENIFYDPNSPNLLSKNALYYIGGLLSHAPAVLAFTNPSTNSYRRLIPGFEAPVNSFFSSGNRSAAIRVPKYATQPENVRFEFRPPDATCNPYLAIPAMLMAGLDGIINKTDPTAAGFGPFDEDVFSWTPEKRSTIKSLPTSLEEALNSLEKDYEFLLIHDVFEKAMLENWVKTKRQESLAVNIRPHPYEIQMYFDL
jgi:glutamine synthetase